MLVVVAVDANDEGGDVTLAWCSDDNLLSASLKMLAGTGLIDEHTGSLDHQVNAHLAPRQLGGVAVRHDADWLAINSDAIISDLQRRGVSVLTDTL